MNLQRGALMDRVISIDSIMTILILQPRRQPQRSLRRFIFSLHNLIFSLLLN